MAQTNQYDVQEVVQSLADSIQHKLVQPSENKFVSLLERTKADFDHRTNLTEEQLNQRLNELNTRIDELQHTQKKMGILCLALSLAVIISIVVQIL